jgi:DNA mismatch repair protein MutS
LANSSKMGFTVSENITPIRQQYLKIKRQYPQVIVFFRLGDFYETFDEDARITSKELEIVLTARSMGKGNSIPMAGIPYHAVDNYLSRLINRGYKVAICEQLTKSGENKGLVQREVVRLVTPGTVVEPGLLNGKTNNYLVSIVIKDDQAGLAYVDITTGEFAVSQTNLKRLISEIERIKPSEILASKNADLSFIKISAPLTRLEEYDYELDSSVSLLIDQFKVASLDGFGCGHLQLAIRAAGGIIRYLRETQKNSLNQLSGLITYSTEDFMALDIQTQNNLELIRSSRTGKTEGSLLAVLDFTKTAMGGRLLRRWLGQPLLNINEIEQRLDAVQWFYDDSISRLKIIGLLSDIGDLERIINRVKTGLALPREVLSLKKGLSVIPELKSIVDCGRQEWLKTELRPQYEVVNLIENALSDNPSSSLDEGGVIRPGFSPELDELRSRSTSSKQYLAGLEKQEKEKTGIKSLKVGYNRVFGYYIEISNANLSQVPDNYIRKQTLVNGERFYTPELKEYESLILHAQERISEMESDLYKVISGQIAASAESILALTRTLAAIDVLASLAESAVRYNYTRPKISNQKTIKIKDGRHPVVERNLPENTFISNDVYLSNEDARLIILTGPNMSGKSTYLRQVALIVLMSQIGSYVPATSADIGIVDRIFTRIGAGEDLAAGKSTFMVEMTETANILNNATSNSLIILDEIGRGTSTYDGLSIARAVAEYIHNSPRLGSKTLFATHYHELVELAEFLPAAMNFNVSVTEDKGEVIFLRKVIAGGVDKSYGIHVAKLAGLPSKVINRAQEVLTDLEAAHGKRTLAKASWREKTEKVTQITFLGTSPAIVEELKQIDINKLSPLDALNKLYEIQQKARES